MKKTSAIFLIAITIFSSILYQNCGGPKSAFESSVSSSSVKSYKDVYPLEFTVGDDVTMEVPQTSFTDYYLEHGVCQWTFTNSTGVVKTVKNPDVILTLPKVAKVQAGLYILTCVNNTLEHRYIFDLTVNDPPPLIDGQPSGPYKFYYVINGVETVQAQESLVTEADAGKRCATATAAAPEANGIKCTWGAKVIFTRAENVPPVRATGTIYFISGGQSSNVGSRSNITRAEADKLCADTAADGRYKKYGMKCVWNGITIFTR
jgi:hypothetical protein